MQVLIVVNNPKDWPFAIPGARVISARAYLTSDEFTELRSAKVFNLCRSYRYQAMGYYVSLLAGARGHKPVPALSTIQELKASEVVRIRSDELDALVQHSLAKIQSDEFTLSIYFGKNLAQRYDRLSAHLFRLFYAPFLRASFARDRDGHWNLQRISAVSADDIPENHRPFVLEVAEDYLMGRRWSAPKPRQLRYELAILFDPKEEEGPSDERAIARFVKAAQGAGLSATVITRGDYARLAEYDGLFIRETTNVNHHTFRFARRAHAEGLIVIDDPDSILLCTNKVYLKELLSRHRVPIPTTMVMHRHNVDQVAAALGFPCILKQPDSAFSQGVVKATDSQSFHDLAERLLAKSELVIAQEYLPTDYDWRIGVIDGKPLWAAKYFMAPNHWQIIKQGAHARRYGKVEAVGVEQVPSYVVNTAVRASNLIGNGLYGVDVKAVGRRAVVVEINDNPSIDAGYEDRVLKEELYRCIMGVFAERLRARHRTETSP
ncbi:MAG TPA: RimK family protein [Polyangiaceae bacterium]|jgi:glutathione synthase/RimK-type ligase-like ATP-grasp enzyme